jgi:hypothetical protein
MLATSLLWMTLTSSPVVAWNEAPPPPPPMERVRPRRGWVWVEGGYEWRRGRYRKLPGHWERERPDRHWHSGRWEWRGDHFEWIAGAWIEGQAYVPPPEMVRQEPPPPPPPPPQAAPPPPPAPRPGFVWIPGTHEWRDNQYVWVEGHWEREHPGDTWDPGHWDHDGDRHAWHAGGWRHGDHGDHDDHDGDRGDRGGYGDRGDRGDRGGYGDHGDRRWRGPALSIAGRVVDRTGRPMAGITMVLAGTSEARVATDGDGRYVFEGLAPGSYAVRPTEPRCGFGPDVVNLNNLGANAVQNFTANCR